VLDQWGPSVSDVFVMASRSRLSRAISDFPRTLFASTCAHSRLQNIPTSTGALLSGALMVVHFLVARLSYSGKLFARVFLHANQPSLFVGLLGAVVHFGGVPKVGVFDNAKIAVTKVLRGRSREQNEVFRAFCRCSGACKDNVFRPIPEYDQPDEINSDLLRFCERDEARHSSVHHETIGERFEREQSAPRPLPAVLPATCMRRIARVNKFAEVIYETNRYSGPSRWAHRDAIVEVFDERLRIIVGDQCVAEHRRCPGRNQTMPDVRHSLD
jgi:hypothetical protein